VRIDMPNPHSVYMHDTNHRNLFSADYRFQSSGCTRVRDVRDLAAWILKDNPGWGRKEIDAEIATQKRTTVRLKHTIPVAWIYLTGWASADGTIAFRKDVYGLDDKTSPPLTVDVGRPMRSAARASGFVLQSDDPETFRPVSYLDSR
jgi:murein L,D-transpeptidase YcbB/YkuD